MKIFGLEIRSVNKQAEVQPRAVRDFFPGSMAMLRRDGASFANMDRIACEIAGLNYAIYDVATKQKVKKHPLYAVLKQPNLEDRHYNFFYQSVIDYYNKGTFWLKSEINGSVRSIFRLDPRQVTITRDGETNKRIFNYNGKRYTDEDLVYIPSRYDYNTKVGGQSIFDAASGVFETASNIDSFTSSSFKNGAVGKRTVIDISGAFPNVTTEQLTELKDSFQSEYSGASNAGRPLIKRKGLDYSEIGSNTDNVNAELSKNRQFQKETINNLFQIPDDDSDVERYFIYLNEFAVRPIATQLQEAINSMLDEDKFYFEFDFNGIMKVSLNSRIDAEVKQIDNGLLTLDEARALNNRPPLPEAGDSHFMPANLMPWNNEIKEAYMAKQKAEVAKAQSSSPLNPDAEHNPQGDDK